MTPYDTRTAKQAESRAVLSEVVALGTAQGLWVQQTPTRTDVDDGGHPAWADVVTPAGHTFTLQAGGWQAEGKLSIALGTLKGPTGCTVVPSHVVSYLQPGPAKASCSASRGASAIIKDFTRRVLGDANTLDIAARMATLLASREADHRALREHIATLVGLGFSCPRVGDAETYSADLWASGGDLPRVKVRACGEVSFEAHLPIAHLPAFLAFLKTAHAK